MKALVGFVPHCAILFKRLAGDPRVPRSRKWMLLATGAYLAFPIDLIPDFIPVLGYLDDVILVPLGILLAVRLIPPGLMDELRATARKRAERPVSRVGALVVVTLWIAAAILVLWAFWPRRVS